MLTWICQYLRNWFERDKYFGDFQINNGVLAYADGTELPLLDGQYFRIIGSILSDGVHSTEEQLADESFSGSVWSMAVPPNVIDLAAEIEVWIEDNKKVIASPYQSESFGGGNYSYTLKGASGGGVSNGDLLNWQTHFAAQLAPWRKI